MSRIKQKSFIDSVEVYGAGVYAFKKKMGNLETENLEMWIF